MNPVVMFFASRSLVNKVCATASVAIFLIIDHIVVAMLPLSANVMLAAWSAAYGIFCLVFFVQLLGAGMRARKRALMDATKAKDVRLFNLAIKAYWPAMIIAGFSHMLLL